MEYRGIPIFRLRRRYYRPSYVSPEEKRARNRLKRQRYRENLRRRKQLETIRLREMETVKEIYNVDEGVSNQKIVANLSLFITCPVCCEGTSDQLSSTICGHLGCLNCFRVWVNKHFNCPVCRKSICNNQIFRIFG